MFIINRDHCNSFCQAQGMALPGDIQTQQSLDTSTSAGRAMFGMHVTCPLLSFAHGLLSVDPR